MFQVNETHQDEATEFGQVQQQELGFSGKCIWITGNNFDFNIRTQDIGCWLGGRAYFNVWETV